MLLFAAIACGRSPPAAAPAVEPALVEAPRPRDSQFEDLDDLLGAWPAPGSCGPGFVLERAPSTTGYGLTDQTVDPPVAYEITGDRRGGDGVLRMALRAGPTGPVAHLELRPSATGDRFTVVWTQPPAEPFDLLTPAGAVACP